MLKNSKKLSAYDYDSACAFYLGAIIVTLICQAVAGIVAAAFAKAYPDIANNGDFNTAFMIIIQVANAGFILLYTRLRRRKFDFTFVRRDGDDKGITPSVIIVPIIAACVLMVGMYLPTVWYGYLTQAMGVPKSAGEIELTTVSAVVMIVIASVALAPVMEETIYRGVLLHGLRREKSVAKAVLFSALAFTLMHMSILQVVFQFALGVLSAFIALKTKRLLPSIILHAFANALALVMEMTPLAEVLSSCELWLTHNIVAAFFITLGLFVGAAGVSVVLVMYGFDVKKALRSIKSKLSKNKGSEAENEEPVVVIADTEDGEESDNATVIRRSVVRSNGTFKYFIGLGICVVMLVINLVTVILS